jgi:hypothetical protein
MRRVVVDMRDTVHRLWLFGLIAITTISLAGCGSNATEGTSQGVQQHDVQFGDGTIAEIVRESGRPVSLSMPEPAGSVEVFRKPNVVVDEMDHLSHLYLKEGTLDELVTEGFRGEPFIGPDGALYWSARICKSPDCDGRSMGTSERPYLMINRLPGVRLDDDGRIVSANTMPSSLVNPCPICGRADYVRQYVMPASAQRRSELVAELSRVRSARARVAKPQ